VAEYAGALSNGRLALELSFDGTLKNIRKGVRVRRADGSFAERTVSQLSGGEWRRLGLALSLGFAELATARLGVRSSLLVLDEAMQHMDAEGQAAMARVLQRLSGGQEGASGGGAGGAHETVMVITHGLASAELLGAFDAVDTVSKAGDESTVRVGDGEVVGVVAMD
jgi:DNA repair exonuclease SbcCD ATPase subunit